MRECSEHGTNSNVCESAGCFAPNHLRSARELARGARAALDTQIPNPQVIAMQYLADAVGQLVEHLERERR